MAIDLPLATGATPTLATGRGRAGQARRKQQQHTPGLLWVGHQDGDGRQGKDRGDHMLMQTGS